MNKLRLLIGDLLDSNGLFTSNAETWREVFARSGKVSDEELRSAGIFEETYIAGDGRWLEANKRSRGDRYAGINIERVILEWREDKKAKEERILSDQEYAKETI
jgi:hypothetical protein